MAKPITIFISYAHKDTSYLQELQTFLKPYSRDKRIEIWTDKNIVAGQKWDELIKARLNESEIILFLVSPDFLASDYINDTEIKNALNNNKIETIAIIIRPIRMNLLKIKYKQAIPTDATPVSNWPSRDNAWNNVLSALEEVFKGINKEYPEPVPDNKPRTKHTNIFTRGNFSDWLMKGLFGLLIAVCIGAFLYGLIKRDSYYYFPCLAGMGIGVLAYFLLHRKLIH